MSLKTFSRTVLPSHPYINRLPILSSITLGKTTYFKECLMIEIEEKKD